MASDPKNVAPVGTNSFLIEPEHTEEQLANIRAAMLVCTSNCVLPIIPS
jgi:hypothetical protein